MSLVIFELLLLQLQAKSGKKNKSSNVVLYSTVLHSAIKDDVFLEMVPVPVLRVFLTSNLVLSPLPLHAPLKKSKSFNLERYVTSLFM